MDVHASEELIARMPAGVVAVSESGLKTAAISSACARLGYRAFLIGERFMAADDPGAALRALLADASIAIVEALNTTDTKDTKVNT